MGRAMNRTLLVATSSVGLVVGGAMSASAHQNDHGDHGYGDHGYWAKGWVKVCQSVTGDYGRWDDGRDRWDDNKRDTRDGHHATDDTRRSGYDDPDSRLDRRYLYDDTNRHDRDGWHRNNLDGRYLVRDSRGRTYSVTLQGRSDCETVRVSKGWAKVSVVSQPDDTRLKSARNVWVKVKRDRVATVQFSYEIKRNHRSYDRGDGHYDHLMADR